MAASFTGWVIWHVASTEVCLCVQACTLSEVYCNMYSALIQVCACAAHTLSAFSSLKSSGTEEQCKLVGLHSIVCVNTLAVQM